MRITIYSINVYCDTRTRGNNLLYGKTVHCDTSVSDVTQVVAHSVRPPFCFRFDVFVDQLNATESEGTIDVYVRFKLRKDPNTSKLDIKPEEHVKLDRFITKITHMLEKLGTAPNTK